MNGLLADGGIDVVVVATPHNTHAALTLAALEAGAHVIVEKPMCITVAEADAMIAHAHNANRMLSVFHNRRWDGDFMAIREVIAKGLLGDVFHVESGSWTYTHPIKTWGAWRADKAISGGAFYDIGAHHLDWVLNLVPGAVVGVSGTVQKRVWHDVTNEDHIGAFLRFNSGAVADVHISHIAHAGRPKWRILGTKGAIVDDRSDERSFRVMTHLEGYPAELTVPYMERTWEAYYQTIADHLLRGAPLAVTPESARRVIAVIEGHGALSQKRTNRVRPVRIVIPGPNERFGALCTTRSVRPSSYARNGELHPPTGRMSPKVRRKRVSPIYGLSACSAGETCREAERQCVMWR